MRHEIFVEGLITKTEQWHTTSMWLIFHIHFKFVSLVQELGIALPETMILQFLIVLHLPILQHNAGGNCLSSYSRFVHWWFSLRLFLRRFAKWKAGQSGSTANYTLGNAQDPVPCRPCALIQFLWKYHKSSAYNIFK